MKSGMDFRPDNRPNINTEERSEIPSKSTQPEKAKSSKAQRFFKFFKSGFTGSPGRMQGEFQSLHKNPANQAPDLTPKSAKAYAVKAAPPHSIEAKVQLAVDAEIAAYPYHRSFEKITQAFLPPKDVDQKFFAKMAKWDTARELSLHAGSAAGLSTIGAKGFIYDKKSGLTAYVLQNASFFPPQIRIVFGGTTSGKHAGGLGKCSFLNGVFSLKQWIANAKNAVLGEIPDSYKQAEKITRHVQHLMKNDPRYADFELKVSGHSKGGGEAEYAALKLENPVEAICFSSAELGKAMREDISEDRKATAARYVTHYKIQGDPVPNLGKVAGELGHLGKVITLPTEHTWNSPIDRHDGFTRHIKYFVNKS